MSSAIFCDTTLGNYIIQEKNGALNALHVAEEHHGMPADDTPLLREACKQLRAYLAGQLRTFTLPIAPEGTDFQQKVWAVLRSIPYGTTFSYSVVASRVTTFKAARAVGAACGKNPLLIIIPCHRALGATGQLVGFSAGSGLPLKRALLAIEGLTLAP